MTDYAEYKAQGIDAMEAKMWAAVARKNNISVPQARDMFYMRMGMAEDWDSMSESDYSYDWSSDGDQTTSGASFLMQPVDKFEAVGVFGWINGNVSTTVNYLEVWINNEKVREYFGYLLSSEENGTYLFDDPIFVTKTQSLKVMPNTTSASSTSKAFPLFWVIKTK